jgi:glycosyltransferase involved in cell wall biosynthesis
MLKEGPGMEEYSAWLSGRPWWATEARRFANRAVGALTRLLGRRLDDVSHGAADRAEDWMHKSKFLDPWTRAAGKEVTAGNDGEKSIVHLIGSLQPGGAERQLCNCVIGSHRLGRNVKVLLLFEPAGDHNHYGNLLTQAGIEVRVAGKHFDRRFISAVKAMPRGIECLNTIPKAFLPWSVDILGELLVDPPDVLHCWLDHPNVWGGIAGLMAGIPRIILSTRNVNPTHFPYLASPYLHAMYRKFSESPSIHFINNSHAGAEDYARWLALPKDRFAVILNGVEFGGISRASEDEAQRLRSELQIPEDAKIVAGVFRLSDEKQPLVFLEVMRRVISKVQGVIAVIAGIGPLEKEMQRFVAAHGLEHHFRFVGRRTDVAAIFSIAALKLLCSHQEGTPNVLLEAQWLSCPVISTKAGGAVDAVSDGCTGVLVEVGDIDGLTKAVMTLLQDVPLRNKMALNGPEYIRKKFGLDRMVKETIATYG